MPRAAPPEIDKRLALWRVAEILDVNKDTLYRWIRSGKLPAKKIGQKWTVAHEDLKALIKDAPG